MVYDTLLKRRSIRMFQPKAVETEKVVKLLRSALLAPSSRNLRPWRFMLVDDKGLIEKLSESKPHGAEFLAGAPVAIVVLGDTAESDVWVEDAAIASAILLLMAEELGLGACWCQIRNRGHASATTADVYVRQLLGVPDPFSVESIVGIGYAAKTHPPYDEARLQYDKLFHNAFGRSFTLDILQNYIK